MSEVDPDARCRCGHYGEDHEPGEPWDGACTVIVDPARRGRERCGCPGFVWAPVAGVRISGEFFAVEACCGRLEVMGRQDCSAFKRLMIRCRRCGNCRVVTLSTRPARRDEEW